MKRVLLFCLFLSFGLICFGQELTVTSVVPDGGIGGGEGSWPSINPVKSRWDNLFDRFNLVRLQDDPFNPNELIQRIGSRAWDAVKAQGDSMTLYFGLQAYTVYLTMGNRRFICLLYNALGDTNRYWFWVYEVR
jgi:hypothetical protein